MSGTHTLDCNQAARSVRKRALHAADAGSRHELPLFVFWHGPPENELTFGDLLGWDGTSYLGAFADQSDIDHGLGDSMRGDGPIFTWPRQPNNHGNSCRLTPDRILPLDGRVKRLRRCPHRDFRRVTVDGVERHSRLDKLDHRGPLQWRFLHEIERGHFVLAANLQTGLDAPDPMCGLTSAR